jgi:hypothetical protein
VVHTDVPRSLAVLFARSLGFPVNVTTWDLFHYWEGQVIGSAEGRAYRSYAISFLILGFELFGTKVGAETRTWAAEHGWAVVWCEPLPSEGHQWAHNELGSIDGRVLDLHSLHYSTVNRTATAAELLGFDKLWTIVGRGNSAPAAKPSDGQLEAWW